MTQCANADFACFADLVQTKETNLHQPGQLRVYEFVCNADSDSLKQWVVWVDVGDVNNFLQKLCVDVFFDYRQVGKRLNKAASGAAFAGHASCAHHGLHHRSRQKLLKAFATNASQCFLGLPLAAAALYVAWQLA